LYRQEQLNGYWFILPAILTLVTLVVYPLLYGGYISLFQTNLINRWNFVGLENYLQLFTRADFGISIWRTFQFTLGTVAGHLVIGLALALLLNVDIPYRAAFRAILIVPWLFPEVVVAMLWKWMFNTLYGIINHSLILVGILSEPMSWLGNPSTAMLAVTLAAIWKGYPFVMVMLLAGLQTIPKDQYEVAEIDGAGPLQIFRHVILPNLRHVLMVVLILDTIWWFKNFAIIWVMTEGGPVNATNVVSINIFKTAFSSFSFGPAAAMAFIVFAICFVIGGAYRFFIGEDDA
jgi:multiple sugar transport system permease protein